ncbi:hypothetical protein TVAG_138420 [Trichomonas vaginalis G3]|uniref:PA14 domain-containing protein n=1 Tax=Trichomonas vaginalis (strain ATCC PRA-98 / G3) TaxID=412133 RepID=A2ENJ5_TRIV3|nr:hypothetical protein TVAGG3_0733150 [Trichomonas vaginalis G3]EAY05773.1 hypothetical protein TVAG_138420 [Trichomonas vaginalis G3]KAI5511404.1 hypothetical protein TVAGG3_0733150 [Trichomonas vaginalis G3]|eukprot:XP_001317996.1 hypothetical protein [Trichomonas vaginalis G3]
MLFLISTFITNKCSYKSNGATGVLKYLWQYYDFDDEVEDRGNFTKYELSDIHINQICWVSGSFCPKQTGEYKFEAWGKPTLYINFDFLGDEEKTYGYCEGRNQYYTKQNIKLYANRCYPLQIGQFRSCIPSGINAKLNDVIIDSSVATLMDCQTQDCLPGYYSDTCEFQTDAYCNEHGTPEYGRTSDGFGCTCTSFDSNIFCEDTSKFVFPEGRRGVSFKSYYNTSRIDASATYPDFSMHEFYESYSTIELNSILYVPQNTYLQFKLSSSLGAQLYINNELVGGSLSDKYECREDDIEVLTTEKKMYNKGNYDIRIVMNSGCAIRDQFVGLEWKFYRWYKNNPPGFEDIPSRYLGTPSN